MEEFMNKFQRWAAGIAVLAVAMLATGCTQKIGRNTMLMMTRANIGIDIDTTPPTSEISIARRELVYAPVFEGGHTLPGYASIEIDQQVLRGFFFGVDSVFAGGQAAAIAALYPVEDRYQAMAQTPSAAPDSLAAASTIVAANDLRNDARSGLCVSEIPTTDGSAWTPDIHMFSKNDVRPLVFGTDTTFGLKVAWSGTTAAYPDSLKLGFNRKEFALAPVFVTDQSPSCNGGHFVNVPPFLARLTTHTEVAQANQTGLAHYQFIATGQAAVNRADDEDVRRALSDDKAYTATFPARRQMILACASDTLGAFDSARFAKLREAAQGSYGLSTTDAAALASISDVVSLDSHLAASSAGIVNPLYFAALHSNACK
jgi:hypothetical protein